jgi:hypothetical protein
MTNQIQNLKSKLLITYFAHLDLGFDLTFEL